MTTPAGRRRIAAPPARIIVVGASGSGKSVLARRLAKRLQLPFIASDGVFWDDEWRPAQADRVSAWLADIVDRPAWILDGNFDRDRAMARAAADLIVWLDMSWPVSVLRVTCRNLWWWAMRTPVWGKERMPLAKAVGGIRHAARSHRLKRRCYPDFFADLADVEVVIVRSTKELRRWLSSRWG